MPPIVDHSYAPTIGDGVGLVGYAHGSALIRKGKEPVRFGPILQRGIIAALSPYEAATPDVALLDVIAGPAASGSPVFDVATGRITGILFEGQIRESAALSMARLIYRSAETPGAVAARITTPRLLGAVIQLPGSAQGSAQSDTITA